ncbi:MAG: S-layer homology domain-containing protein [Ruminococcus sp.]|nr:S-layer homology domain-containing protein [Ruminococcus sp.]
MKRKTAAICALIMASGIISSFPAAISAETAAPKTAAASASKNEQEGDADLEAAITLVKSRITIPEEYSEFSYSAGESRGVKTYSFEWRSPTDTNAYYASVSGSIIDSYSSPLEYSGYTGKPAFTSLSKKDFINKAISWVYRVNPEMSGHLSADSENVSLSVSSDRVNIMFERNYGGIEVANNRVYVTLDKRTGEIWSYNASWWQGAKFEAAGKAVDQETIKAVYVKDVTIKPWYRISEEAGKKTAKVVYEPQISFVYDAFTGKNSTMNSDYAAMLNTDLYETGAALDTVDEEPVAVELEEDIVEAGSAINPATGVTLTDNEKAAAADLSRMLTAARFKELLIKDKYLEITDKYLISNFSISESQEAECGYSISCNVIINNKELYRDIYIEADAESGNIISFSNWNAEESSSALNVSSANKLAEDAAKYYFGNIFNEYKADPENTAPVVNTKQRKDTNRTIKYYRYVNNIQVSGDYINISVNSAGKVTAVSSRYTDDVDFGDGKIITKEACLSMLCKQQDMTLKYDGFTDYSSVPHTYLTYSMPKWYINGKTGKLCDYYGSSETDASSSVCPYTDIESSPYKKEIQTLYEYGVTTVNGSKFMPQEKITPQEMSVLITRLNGYVALGYDELTEDFTEGGMSADKYLTRLGLAKMFTEYAGVADCAEFTSIYKSPFKDVADNDENLGYLALAYALGAIRADANGNYHPTAAVTREYAYHCLYQYIANGQNSKHSNA